MSKSKQEKIELIIQYLNSSNKTNTTFHKGENAFEFIRTEKYNGNILEFDTPVRIVPFKEFYEEEQANELIVGLEKDPEENWLFCHTNAVKLDGEWYVESYC